MSQTATRRQNRSGSLDGVLHWNEGDLQLRKKARRYENSWQLKQRCYRFTFRVRLIPKSANTLPFQLSHVQGPQSGLFYTRHLDWQNTEHRECKVPVWGWWPCGYPISRQICSLCWSSGWIVAQQEVTRFFTRLDHGFHDGQKPKRNDFGGSEVRAWPG